MALILIDQQQPLADVGRYGRRASSGSILAGCGAGELLFNELVRYCGRRVDGRSILLAGLRGAGKTTLVTSAIQNVANQSADGNRLPMRPLPVVLLGPNLFLDAGAFRTREDDEKTRGRVLEQVVLGLYAALSRELVQGFREIVRPAAPGAPESQQGLELATALEIRLPEGPSPSEMREFWRCAGALESGVLFRNHHRQGQGMLELAAISGMGYAYQRVSGTFTESSQSVTSTSTADERASGWDMRLAEAVKPIASLASGAAVATAAAPHGLPMALAGGAIAALAAGAFFRFSTTRVRKEEDKRDYTFLPDTRPETLDRVLPALIQRLKNAGLAPVIVFDELDKVDDLWARHDSLLKNMKKLFAETVFTCSLVNRNFIESLRDAQVDDRYGRNFSYFSHRAYVSYEPRAMHDYLDQLIEVDGGR
ncbi:MAG: hypothetical protein ABJD97_06300 [Betaproteobacteria bacterium]